MNGQTASRKACVSVCGTSLNSLENRYELGRS